MKKHSKIYIDVFYFKKNYKMNMNEIRYRNGWG